MPRPKLEVVDIFRTHGAAYRKTHAGHLNLPQLKVMSAIEHCRTFINAIAQTIETVVWFAMGPEGSYSETITTSFPSFSSAGTAPSPSRQGPAGPNTG